MSSRPVQPDLASAIEDIRGLKECVKKLECEVETSKKENKGWIKKWGVYLGILASVIAVPKALKEAINSWYQRPDLKIGQPMSLTLTRGLTENILIFSFPVNASNYGNGPGAISGGRAHLGAKSSAVSPTDAADSNFYLSDENNESRKMPFPMPAGLAKTLTGYVSFGNAVRDPGWYQLEVTLNGDDGRPVPQTPMKFCFDVTESQIENLSRRPVEHLYPYCDLEP